MDEKILFILMVGLFYSVTTVVAGPRHMHVNKRNVSRPPYIHCVSSDECSKSSCCSVNQGRYSVPKCRPRPEIGQFCRPGNTPMSTNVTYPDNATVHLKDVYLIHCPCQGHLTCSSFGMCIDPSEDAEFNYLHDLSD